MGEKDNHDHSLLEQVCIKLNSKLPGRYSVQSVKLSNGEVLPPTVAIGAGGDKILCVVFSADGPRNDMVSIKGASELLVAVPALAIASNISCLAIGFAKVSRSLHTRICHGCKAQSAVACLSE